MALGKENLKIKIKNLCRVPDGGHSAKTDTSGRRDPSRQICRGPICRGLGPYFAEGRLFVEGLALPRAPGAGPRQRPLCRVPEIWPSAKPKALGKEAVSSSDL